MLAAQLQARTVFEQSVTALTQVSLAESVYLPAKRLERRSV
jgi:hypothetical protein